MAYVADVFADGVGGNTPITAAKLNKLGQGIVAADITNPASAATTALAAAITAQAEPVGLSGTTQAGLSNAYAGKSDLRNGRLREISPLVRLPMIRTAPTVTLSAGSAASSIASPQYITPNDASIRWSGVKSVPVYYSPGFFYYGDAYNTSTLDGSVYSIDFVHYGRYCEPALSGNGAGRSYQIFVDGVALTSTPVLGPANDSLIHRLLLDFGTAGLHHIRILTNAGINTVAIGANDSIYAATIPLGRKDYFLGDSWTAASGADGLLAQGLATYASEVLGSNQYNGGQAGTGYTIGGSGGRTTFQQRISTDVIPANPDRIIIIGSRNDTDPTAVGTAARATYSALASALPNVPVYVFGIQYPSTVANAGFDALDAAIASAAAAAPNVKGFFSMKSWITGTGRVGSATGTGNADIFISSDGVHPTSAGHQYYGDRIAQSIAGLY